VNKNQSGVHGPEGKGAKHAEPRSFRNFDEFFNAEYRQVIGFLMVQGAGLEEAKDAAQEAMTEVAQRWSSIKHPRAYVRLIARRAYYRMDADDRRARSPNGGTRVELDSDVAINTAVLQDWVETLAELDAILNAFQTLPATQREVVALYLSGLTPQQIAVGFEMNPATVRSNLRHGLGRLRAILAIPDEAPTRTGRHRNEV